LNRHETEPEDVHSSEIFLIRVEFELESSQFWVFLVRDGLDVADDEVVDLVSEFVEVGACDEVMRVVFPESALDDLDGDFSI